jgi:dipeptidyl aminopeptidase/acylaminoacyl peptidase
VDALVLYRQVQLPFMVGEENFKKIKWRLGDITSFEEPLVIMENIPVCASCHQVSADGQRISMEMNYNNDSGAQFVADVGKNIILSQADFMTWTDYPKPDILPKTRGLFARMSPSGKYIASTVNEISFAALTNDPAYCQVFFPTYGILACYSVAEKTFSSLTGADDTNFIQTNPDWSPDEKYITFARAETKNAYHEDISNIKTRIEDRGAEDINQEFPVQFDIWKMPFNNGNGGPPEPLAGASDNGMSNYFARYSPDGRWIVFTQSQHGIMLQYDSRLLIVSSEGGTAREMRCNQKRFNSWHSWSPNGRWLLFSSKVNSIYTEIFITHIDENGNDSVPVCLSRFSDRSLAANLPEFVSLNAGQIQKIRVGN